VRRSRSCFAVGEVSRVTVWFVSGRHISCTPAVVNVSSGEVLQSAYTCPTVATPMISSTSPSTTQSTAATDQSGTHPTSDTPQSTPGPAQNGMYDITNTVTVVIRIVKHATKNTNYIGTSE
jgi:hypothetical protein